MARAFEQLERASERTICHSTFRRKHTCRSGNGMRVKRVKRERMSTELGGEYREKKEYENYCHLHH